MIDIIKHDKNTIVYVCSCGTHGRCVVKPTDNNAVIIIDINCPTCGAIERITLLQYSTDEDKKSLLENLDTIDLSWVPAINEEIDHE